MRRATGADELLLALRATRRALRGDLRPVVAAGLAPFQALAGEPCSVLERWARQLRTMRLDACPRGEPVACGDADRGARERAADLAAAVEIDREIQLVDLRTSDMYGDVALLADPAVAVL